MWLLYILSSSMLSYHCKRCLFDPSTILYLLLSTNDTITIVRQRWRELTIIKECFLWHIKKAWKLRDKNIKTCFMSYWNNFKTIVERSMICWKVNALRMSKDEYIFFCVSSVHSYIFHRFLVFISICAKFPEGNTRHGAVLCSRH